MKVSNYNEISTHIARREHFKGNSSQGCRSISSTSFSRLPHYLCEEYDHARRAGRIEYTVLSYGTPVAWVTTDGEVRIPEVKYSATTSRLQQICRVNLSAPLHGWVV